MDPPTGPSLGPYDYDLLVIGGGSGGLAVAKVSALSSHSEYLQDMDLFPTIQTFSAVCFSLVLSFFKL